MVLITGGAFHGKLEYALNLTGIPKEDIINGKNCTMEDLLNKPLVNHFHLWIDRILREDRDIYELINLIQTENPNLIIIVDELGCGIVPMDPYDREYREVTGRVCCEIAKIAKKVHRVTCGIGMVIKYD